VVAGFRRATCACACVCVYPGCAGRRTPRRTSPGSERALAAASGEGAGRINSVRQNKARQLYGQRFQPDQMKKALGQGFWIQCMIQGLSRIAQDLKSLQRLAFSKVLEIIT
jgi:hypothetical protein